MLNPTVRSSTGYTQSYFIADQVHGVTYNLQCMYLCWPHYQCAEGCMYGVLHRHHFFEGKYLDRKIREIALRVGSSIYKRPICFARRHSEIRIHPSKSLVQGLHLVDRVYRRPMWLFVCSSKNSQHFFNFRKRKDPIVWDKRKFQRY